MSYQQSYPPYGGPPSGYPPAGDRPVFFVQSQLNPELVLYVEGGNTNRGAKLIVWQRKQSDYANQLFTFTSDGFIENVKSGLVLDVEGGGGAGSKVIVWDRKPHHEAQNQKWQYDYSNQTFHCGPFVLDIEGGNRNAGAKLVAWHAKPNHDNINQRFTLVPATVPPAAYPSYPAQPAPYQPSYPQPSPYPQPGGYPPQPGYAPQPGYGGGFAPQPGGYPPQPGGYPPQPGFAPQPGGQPLGCTFGQPFFIQSELSDLVLDVEGGNRNPGAHVILWPRKGGRDAGNQLWRITQDGYIENVQSGLVLDVKGGGGPGTHMIMWNKKPPQDAANQRFNFNPMNHTARTLNGLTLDVEGGNRNQGTKLCVWHSKADHENHNQRFRMLPYQG